MSGPIYVFLASGTGTNLIRSTTVGGRTIRLKTGHGFFRAHTGPGGKVTDLRLSGLTPDEIETEIVQDIENQLASGIVFPKPGPGFAGPLVRTITIGPRTIENRVIESPGGSIDVATYYEA